MNDVRRWAPFGRRIAALAVVGAAMALLPTAASAATWQGTDHISQGQTGGNGSLNAALTGASEDGSRVFVSTSEQLAATDTDAAQDIYMREGATTTHISQGQINGNGPNSVTFARASQNGSRVFFVTVEQLAATDTDGAPDVYMREGATTTQISQGQINGNGALLTTFASASQDGSRVFFSTNEQLAATDTDAAQDLYMREGATTTQISQGQINGNGAAAASFGGASQDGSRVFFLTGEQLAATDTDASTDLYMREGATTTQISQGQINGNGAFSASFLGASQNGSRVFFFTGEQLAATDTDSQPDIYMREGSTTTQITQGQIGGNGAFGPGFSGASQDGSRVFFPTSEQLAATDTDAAQDLYMREGATTTQISQGQINGNGAVAASFGGASQNGSRVFFVTNEQLAATDTDSVSDLYMREGSTTTQITQGQIGGNGAFGAGFAGASQDGSRVFFFTAEQLAATDTDAVHDIYVREGATTTQVTQGAVNGNGAIPISLVLSASSNADGSRFLFLTSEQLALSDTDVQTDVYQARIGSAPPASPTLSTSASANVTLGGQDPDTATIEGGQNPPARSLSRSTAPTTRPARAQRFSQTPSRSLATERTCRPVSPLVPPEPTAGSLLTPATPANGAVSGACNDAGETVVGGEAGTCAGQPQHRPTSRSAARFRHGDDRGRIQPDRDDHVQGLRQRRRLLRLGRLHRHQDRHVGQRQLRLRRLHSERRRHLSLDGLLFRRRQQQRRFERLQRARRVGRRSQSRDRRSRDRLGRHPRSAASSTTRRRSPAASTRPARVTFKPLRPRRRQLLGGGGRSPSSVGVGPATATTTPPTSPRQPSAPTAGLPPTRVTQTTTRSPAPATTPARTRSSPSAP